jgi:hypothetical protein
MGAANQDQQRAAVRKALILVQVLSPSAASCADRGVLERAQHCSLQSADRHMRDVVGSRNIGLRLARSKQVHCFLTVGQNTFAHQSSRQRCFDTQAIGIIDLWDSLRTWMGERLSLRATRMDPNWAFAAQFCCAAQRVILMY